MGFNSGFKGLNTLYHHRRRHHHAFLVVQT